MSLDLLLVFNTVSRAKWWIGTSDQTQCEATGLGTIYSEHEMKRQNANWGDSITISLGLSFNLIFYLSPWFNGKEVATRSTSRKLQSMQVIIHLAMTPRANSSSASLYSSFGIHAATCQWSLQHWHESHVPSVKIASNHIHAFFVSPSYFPAGAFSFLAASCKSSVSTCSGGIWIYLTTLPRTKQLFRATSCGYFSGLTIFTFKSFTFRYWSTLCRVPVRTTSFFNSTAISFPTKVLKKDRKIYASEMQTDWISARHV